MVIEHRFWSLRSKQSNTVINSDFSVKNQENVEYLTILWKFSKFVLFFSPKGAEIDLPSVELLFKKFIQSDTKPFLKGFLHNISPLCGSEPLLKHDVGKLK